MILNPHEILPSNKRQKQHEIYILENISKECLICCFKLVQNTQDAQMIISKTLYHVQQAN